MSVATERTVFTFSPGPWPKGVITGVSDEHGGFVIEHVIAFTPRVLLPMLRAGVEEATRLGYTHLLFGIPHDFPPARKLALVAGRVGFFQYAEDAERFYCVRYLP